MDKWLDLLYLKQSRLNYTVNLKSYFANSALKVYLWQKFCVSSNYWIKVFNIILTKSSGGALQFYVINKLNDVTIMRPNIRNIYLIFFTTADFVLLTMHTFCNEPFSILFFIKKKETFDAFWLMSYFLENAVYINF